MRNSSSFKRLTDRLIGVRVRIARVVTEMRVSRAPVRSNRARTHRKTLTFDIGISWRRARKKREKKKNASLISGPLFERIHLTLSEKRPFVYIYNFLVSYILRTYTDILLFLFIRRRSRNISYRRPKTTTTWRTNFA